MSAAGVKAAVEGLRIFLMGREWGSS